jgi:programmed cell death protein 5
VFELANDNAAESDNQAKMKKEVYRRLREMQIEQEKKALAKRFMTPEAYERLMNVRVANYELYSQLLELLIAMAKNNKIASKLTEEQLTDLLSRLTYRPESKIEFKHK